MGQVIQDAQEAVAQQCPATYRDVFGVGEFRAMFTAQLASLFGDQAAALAVAVLFYQRTGSALLAALGYATAYLPWTIGGTILSPLADRIPPRVLLVICDLVRALLIGSAAIPGMPLPWVGLLVLVAAFFAPPFEAAHAALLPQVLTGDRYVVGLSIGNAVHQSTQLAGFLLGGALVAAVSAEGALALDAVSFALSGALLSRGLTSRPAGAAATTGADTDTGTGTGADTDTGTGTGADTDTGAGTVRVPASRSLVARLFAESTEGLRVVAADRRRFGPLLLGAVGAGYVIVPEAIAPAYVHALGQGPAAVGLVMASVAGGTVAGNLLLGRFASAARRRALMWPMAMAGTLPLVAVAVRPGLLASVVLFGLAGAAAAFQVAANTAFVDAVPVPVRGRAFGVAMTGMYAVQALAIVAAGAAAGVMDPRTVVVSAAVLGALALLVLRATGLRGDAARKPQAEPAGAVAC